MAEETLHAGLGVIDPVTGERGPTNFPPIQVQPKTAGEGLRVRMSRLAGFTQPGFLVRPFHFQVSPIEDVDIPAEHGWTDYETFGGMYSRKGVRRLKEITINTLFLDDKPTWSLLHQPGFRANPLKMAKQLAAIADRGIIFRLTIHQAALWGKEEDYDGPARLQSVHRVERPGEPDARYISATFVEYRHPKLKTRRPPPDTPATVSVRSLPANRDSLSELAKFYYGSASKWRLIAKRNGLTNVSPNADLQSLPRFRKPNAKLHIPKGR